jgi:MFS family permease
MLALSGLAGMVFNVVGVSLRQAIVPDRLIGRVVSAFRMLAYGAVPLGAILGGIVGRALGVRAPFLLGAALLAACGVLVLPVVNDRAVQAARVAAEAVQSTSKA